MFSTAVSFDGLDDSVLIVLNFDSKQWAQGFKTSITKFCNLPYKSTARTAHIICILVIHLSPPMYFLIVFFSKRYFSAESNIPEITSGDQYLVYFHTSLVQYTLIALLKPSD